MKMKRWGMRISLIPIAVGIVISVIFPALNIQDVAASSANDKFGVVGRRSREQIINSAIAKSYHRFLEHCIQGINSFVYGDHSRVRHPLVYGNVTGGSNSILTGGGATAWDDQFSKYHLRGTATDSSGISCHTGGVINALLRHLEIYSDQNKRDLICNRNNREGLGDSSGGIMRPLINDRGFANWDINCYDALAHGLRNTDYHLLRRNDSRDAVSYLNGFLEEKGFGWVTQDFTPSELYFMARAPLLHCAESGRDTFGAFTNNPDPNHRNGILSYMQIDVNPTTLAVNRGSNIYVEIEATWWNAHLNGVSLGICGGADMATFMNLTNTANINAAIAEIRAYMEYRCQQKFYEWIESNAREARHIVNNAIPLNQEYSYYVLTYTRSEVVTGPEGPVTIQVNPQFTFYTSAEFNALDPELQRSSEEGNNVRRVMSIPDGAAWYFAVGSGVAFWSQDTYDRAIEVVRIADGGSENVYDPIEGCDLPDDVLGELRDLIGSDASRADPDNTCENLTGGGFQWILCPAIDGGLGIINWWMRIMESQLAFNVLAGDSTEIRDMWGRFLIIANIAFAIVFLAIIYSTATSTGISNYGIKKIMPRIIIGAILVNTSFWIAAGISDLINILGHNIRDLILGMGHDADLRVSPPWGHTFAIGLGVAALLLFTGLIAPAVLAIITMFALLTFRNVAIIILIMISPIAFVLWLLPNTEKYFKMWLNNYIRLLFVYPVVMAGWAASTVLAGIFNHYSEGFVAWVAQLFLWVAPVALIIPAFKLGGSLMGRIQGMTQSGINKAGAPAVAANKKLAEANRKGAGGLSRNTLQNLARKPEYNKEAGQYEKTNLFGKNYKTRNSDKLMELRKAAEADGPEAVAAFDKASRSRNFMQRSLGFIAGIGTGAYGSMTNELSENAKANTDSALSAERFKLNLKHSAASLRTELEKQKIELDVKMRADVVDFEGAKIAAKASAEAGVNSPAFRALLAAQAREPNNANITNQVEAFRDKLLKDAQAQTQNNMTIRDSNGTQRPVNFSVDDLLSGKNTYMAGADGKAREVNMQKFLDGEYNSDGPEGQIINKQIMSHINTAVQNSSSLMDGSNELNIGADRSAQQLLNQIASSQISGTLKVNPNSIQTSKNIAEQQTKQVIYQTRGGSGT